MSNQQYQKRKWKKTNEKPNPFHKTKDYYIQEIPMPSKEASEPQEEQEQQQPIDNSDYLLFPGEQYEYSQRLMRTDLFEIINGLQTSKKSAVLTFDKQEAQTLRTVGKYYSPEVNDLVIGIVAGKLSETYRIDIGTYCNASLNKKELDGNKNSKSEYDIGDAVLCKVTAVNKNDSPQLTCLNEKKKAVVNYCDMPLGRLGGGTIYPVSLSDTPVLSKSNATLKKIKMKWFNCSICVGSNGRLWVTCGLINVIHKIYQVIALTLENKVVDENEIDKMIKEMI